MKLKVYITDYADEFSVVNKDLIFSANATNILDVVCRDELEQTVSITGATAKFIVKEKPSDTDASAKILKTVTDLTSPTAGEFQVEITPDECDDLSGNYIYELRILLSELKREYVLANGNITFQKSIYEIPGEGTEELDASIYDALLRCLIIEQ